MTEEHEFIYEHLEELYKSIIFKIRKNILYLWYLSKLYIIWNFVTSFSIVRVQNQHKTSSKFIHGISAYSQELCVVKFYTGKYAGKSIILEKSTDETYDTDKVLLVYRDIELLFDTNIPPAIVRNSKHDDSTTPETLIVEKDVWKKACPVEKLCMKRQDVAKISSKIIRHVNNESFDD